MHTRNHAVDMSTKPVSTYSSHQSSYVPPMPHKSERLGFYSHNVLSGTPNENPRNAKSVPASRHIVLLFCFLVSFAICAACLQIPFLAERTDLVALLDEFASRFFDELDYVKECTNGIQIREQMKHIKQVHEKAGFAFF